MDRSNKTLVLEFLELIRHLLHLGRCNRYGDFATGVTPGIRSIRNSTSRVGGNPDRSLGNTSGKPQTIEMSSSFFSSIFMLERCFRSSFGRSPRTSRVSPSVGCGCGGNGKFHGGSSCEDDSVDDSRLIKVKKIPLNLTVLVDEALEVLDLVTL
ncbi:hypothetical protein Tco_1331536 [Tanacetum coccineum]